MDFINVNDYVLVTKNGDYFFKALKEFKIIEDKYRELNYSDKEILDIFLSLKLIINMVEKEIK